MSWLRAPGADDDKRSMGVLGVVTGSDRYPGAAVLGVEAAWRTGVGTVRLWAPRRVQDLVLARRPETVCHELDEPVHPVSAWLLGSGQDARDRGSRLRALLLDALASGAPCVVDAGALDLVGRAAGRAVATPHAGELSRVLRALGRDLDAEAVRADPAAAAADAAAALDAVVLLKGATTHVAAPDGTVEAVAATTHRLAVAGSGDVLGGLLGAALAVSAGAGGMLGLREIAEVAAEGARRHAAAALRASSGDVGAQDRPIAALDIAEALRDVV